VCPELEQMARGKSIETREILLDRRVLSMGNGRIRLNMWLFAEYIRNKYGMRRKEQ
jgi:phosphoheptose isomerase